MDGGGRNRASDGDASTDASSSTTKEVGRSDDAIITVLIIIIIVLPIALFLCAWTQSHMWAARQVDLAQAPTPAAARRPALRTVPTGQRYQSLPRAVQPARLPPGPRGPLQFKL